MQYFMALQVLWFLFDGGVILQAENIFVGVGQHTGLLHAQPLSEV